MKKSFDTSPGEGTSEEGEQTSCSPTQTENPVEITVTTPEDIASEGDETLQAGEAIPTAIVLQEQAVTQRDEPISVLLEGNPDGRLYEVHPSLRRRFCKLTHEQLLNWSPYWAVLLLAGLLRFWDLGAKPLHHDESLHAYFALHLLQNLQHWGWCVGLNNPPVGYSCYQYDPLLHGPFQFHAISLVYQISQWLGAPDNGVNTTTVRIMAALLGTVLVGLPYFLRDYLGKIGAWLTCFLLAVSPSMVYFSRFARESIYMACFTLLLVAATGRYVRDRKIGWLVLAAAAFALSYATSEATFLTIAVFGSFLGALIVWEIGSKFSLQTQFVNQVVGRYLLRSIGWFVLLVAGVAFFFLSGERFGVLAVFLGALLIWEVVLRFGPGARFADQFAERYLPRTAGPVFVLIYFVFLGIAAKFFFGLLNTLSTSINNNTAVADQDLLQLESITVRVLPWLGILLGLVVFSILALEVYGVVRPGRRGLAKLVDRRQPVLDTILTMPWTHWFFALMVGVFLFLFLFTVVFTNIAGGIGDGIWKGLYYWLEQQQVARGGQPWYYYLLLIPLYEQIGVVFALVGMVRSFIKPNAFRLFLVYWFLGDFFLYSWAGEKMPWLMIFLTVPMMFLAAIGLEPSARACYRLVKEHFFSRNGAPVDADELPQPHVSGPSAIMPRRVPGIFGVVMALLFLIPTLHNMVEVTYIEPADGPHEMMIYVQTTPDVNSVMDKINELDQKDFGGKHQMKIGVMADAEWPFAWYLRDYPNVCYGFPKCDPSWLVNMPVIIGGGDNPQAYIQTYSAPSGPYFSHIYDMRSWWDEGYKLPACQPGQAPSLSCANPSLGTGVGPLLWLSYGDNPPPDAKFNLGLAAQRVWNWWWYRVPFGSTSGAYNMVLFIKSNLGVRP